MQRCHKVICNNAANASKIVQIFLKYIYNHHHLCNKGLIFSYYWRQDDLYAMLYVLIYANIFSKKKMCGDKVVGIIKFQYVYYYFVI